MKILLVTDDFPPAIGGIASYLRDLYGDADRVVARGRWLPHFLATVRAILRTRPSMLSAGTLFSSGAVVLAASALFRIPYAVHVYGTDLTTRRRSRLMERLAGTILRRAARIIVISDFSAAAAAAAAGSARIVKIVPPVDTARFVPGTRGDGPPLLLTVGRLVPRKGHDTVLRALPLVLAHIPEVRYAIVGDGPGRARLEALARELGLEHAVQFAGAVDDVVPWVQACDVFVMMSRDEEGEVEGFGIAFAEAAACGKPVIAGRSGGTAEAVIDGVTGVLVDGERALAEEIVNLLTDRERAARMGRAGRERAERELGVAAAAARLRAIAAELQR